MDTIPRSRARQSAPPKTVERDGKKFVVDRGHDRECVTVPADKPDNDLLNFAAAAVLCDLSWACIYQRQARGWATNGSKPLPEAKRGQRFIRRGDLLRAIAPRAEGETRERFLLDGTWVLVKGRVAFILNGLANAPIDRLCKRLGLEFRSIRSPITRKRALVCNEQAVLAAKRVLDAEPPRSTTPPPLAGRETMWLIDFLRAIRIAKGGASTVDAADKRPSRLAVIGWIKVGCVHLDCERLRAKKEASGWRDRWYVDRQQAELIVESIKASKAGTVHPSRKLLRTLEAEHEFGIGRPTLNLLARHRMINRVRNRLGRFYWRDELQKVRERRDTPRGDGPDGRPLRSLAESAALHGVRVRQLRRGIQVGRLKSHGQFARAGSLLVHEHLVSDADVLAFITPPDWQPTNGFVPVHEIARTLKLQIYFEYAALQLSLREGARRGALASERPPNQRLPIYYELAEARSYLDMLKPRPRGGQVKNAARDAELAELYTTPGTIAFKSPAGCIELYNQRRQRREEWLDSDKTGRTAVSKALKRFLKPKN
jgi:hypothetical protein